MTPCHQPRSSLFFFSRRHRLASKPRGARVCTGARSRKFRRPNQYNSKSLLHNPYLNNAEKVVYNNAVWTRRPARYREYAWATLRMTLHDTSSSHKPNNILLELYYSMYIWSSHRRYFQHAHFIPIVAVGKRGAH